MFIPEPRPDTLKTNIAQITKHILYCITQQGVDVVVTYSKRTKSRYLEIAPQSIRPISVRISDHPAGQAMREKYDFDIHTQKKENGLWIMWIS